MLMLMSTNSADKFGVRWKLNVLNWFKWRVSEGDNFQLSECLEYLWCCDDYGRQTPELVNKVYGNQEKRPKTKKNQTGITTPMGWRCSEISIPRYLPNPSPLSPCNFVIILSNHLTSPGCSTSKCNPAILEA